MTSSSSSIMIIGLCGYARTGKDTIAEYLEEDWGFVQIAFADKVRDMAWRLNHYFPELEEDYQSLINRIGYDSAKTSHKEVRDYIINVAESTKEILGENVWVNAAFTELSPTIELTPSLKLVVISDVRHLNEAEKIKSLGGVLWKINRKGIKAANMREEESIAQINCDAEIENSSTFEELCGTIDTHLRPMLTKALKLIFSDR